MYAIIENGGKQYKAYEGEYIEIDLLPDEEGMKKSFDNVLLLSTDGKVEVGEPFLKGVSVDGTILAHFKGPKLIVFKYRAKQRFRVKTGHRQKYTRVLINSIAFPGKAEVTKKSEQAKPKVTKGSSAKKPASVTKKASEKVVKSKASSTTPKEPAVDKKKAAITKPAAVKKTAVKKTAVKKTAVKKTTTKKTAAKKPSADKK